MTVRVTEPQAEQAGEKTSRIRGAIRKIISETKDKLPLPVKTDLPETITSEEIIPASVQTAFVLELTYKNAKDFLDALFLINRKGESGFGKPVALIIAPHRLTVTSFSPCWKGSLTFIDISRDLFTGYTLDPAIPAIALRFDKTGFLERIASNQASEFNRLIIDLSRATNGEFKLTFTVLYSLQDQEDGEFFMSKRFTSSFDFASGLEFSLLDRIRDHFTATVELAPRCDTIKEIYQATPAASRDSFDPPMVRLSIAADGLTVQYSSEEDADDLASDNKTVKTTSETVMPAIFKDFPGGYPGDSGFFPLVLVKPFALKSPRNRTTQRLGIGRDASGRSKALLLQKSTDTVDWYAFLLEKDLEDVDTDFSPPTVPAGVFTIGNGLLPGEVRQDILAGKTTRGHYEVKNGKITFYHENPDYSLPDFTLTDWTAGTDPGLLEPLLEQLATTRVITPGIPRAEQLAHVMRKELERFLTLLESDSSD